MKTPIKIPVMIIKQKQAFEFEEKVMRYIGNPVEIAKELKEKGIILIHIYDKDAEKGVMSNFNIYDALTSFINIQVELRAKKENIKKLESINARSVIGLPCPIELKEFKKGFLVGKVREWTPQIRDVKDVILERWDQELAEKCRKEGKRIIFKERRKGIFGYFVKISSLIQ